MKLKVLTIKPHYIYRYIERKRGREGGGVWYKRRLCYTEHLKSKVGGQKDNHCLTKCGSIYHILCLEKVRQNHGRLVCTYRACTSIPWVQALSSRSSPKAFPKRWQGHSVTVLKRSRAFRCILLENVGGTSISNVCSRYTTWILN